jgi:hypothetical protein
MTDWPSIQNPWDIKEQSRRSTIRTPFEAGYVQTRSRHTRARKAWTLTWAYMPAADKTTLEEFFEDTVAAGGLAFDWTDPTSDTEYSVRFAKDEIEYELVDAGGWKVSVDLEEV